MKSCTRNQAQKAKRKNPYWEIGRYFTKIEICKVWAACGISRYNLEDTLKLNF